MAGGDTIIVRYADDFVCGFQRLGDARRFLRDLGERLAHLNCTRKIIEFGRFARANRRKQGKTFDFLGMTHFCEQTRKGRFRVGPSRKRAPCGGSRRPCAGGGTITGTKRPSGELSTAATTPFQEAACRSSYTNANSCVPFGDAPKRTSPGTQTPSPLPTEPVAKPAPCRQGRSEQRTSGSVRGVTRFPTAMVVCEAQVFVFHETFVQVVRVCDAFSFRRDVGQFLGALSEGGAVAPGLVQGLGCALVDLVAGSRLFISRAVASTTKVSSRSRWLPLVATLPCTRPRTPLQHGPISCLRCGNLHVPTTWSHFLLIRNHRHRALQEHGGLLP